MKRVRRFGPSTLAALAALFLAVGGNIAGVFAETPDEIAALRSFSDAARLWGNGAERFIEEAYRLCFRTFIIGGKIMNIRVPFAENHERDQLVEGGWNVVGMGKADPAELWPIIEETLAGADFAAYTAALGDGREKVIIFDMSKRKWTVSADLFDIARMKAGVYRGLPHRPYVLSSGRGIEENDVYNYLYCVAWTGMDCSGFVWHSLAYLARRNGVDLGALLRKTLGTPRGSRASYYVGTAFFASRSSEITQVPDTIGSLRPADVILFRSSTGGAAHSAIIQSIDWKTGVIRYLQNTDEAPQLERGVHESFIRFDPAKTGVSLKDTSLVWTQRRFPPFPGEWPSGYINDGVRFRAFGGGKVVRLKHITAVISKLKK